MLILQTLHSLLYIKITPYHHVYRILVGLLPNTPPPLTAQKLPLIAHNIVPSVTYTCHLDCQ